MKIQIIVIIFSSQILSLLNGKIMSLKYEVLSSYSVPFYIVWIYSWAYKCGIHLKLSGDTLLLN